MPQFQCYSNLRWELPVNKPKTVRARRLAGQCSTGVASTVQNHGNGGFMRRCPFEMLSSPPQVGPVCAWRAEFARPASPARVPVLRRASQVIKHAKVLEQCAVTMEVQRMHAGSMRAPTKCRQCVKQRSLTLCALLPWLELAEVQRKSKSVRQVKRRCDPSASVSLQKRDSRALGSEDRVRAVGRFNRSSKGQRNTRHSRRPDPLR